MDVRAGENWCGKFVDWRDCTIYQDKCIDGQKYMKKRNGESERHNVTDDMYGVCMNFVAVKRLNVSFSFYINTRSVVMK